MSWPQVELSQLTQPAVSCSPQKEWGVNVPFTYIDLSAVDKDTKIITELSEISTDEAPSRARQKVQKGDVLVSTVRPNLNGIAQVRCTYKNPVASTGFTVLRSNEERLNARYLYYWVQSPRFVETLVLQATGASYPAVSDKIVKATKIPLPPLSEQKRIAEILDCADAIRRTRQETLKTCDELLRSTFLEMFGDPVTNPMGWEVKSFTEMATLQRGFDLPVQDRCEGSVPIFAANGPVGTHNIAKVKGPGVITGRSGTIGKVHFIADNYWPLNTSLWVNDFHGNNPRWVANFIKYYKIERFVRGTGVPTLNRNLVHTEEVGVPPLELQERYANIEEDLLNGVRNLIESKSLEETLFNSLVQRAFRGEL